MYVLYYTIGLIICMPYIMYVVIINKGDLEKTIKHLKETWDSVNNDDANKINNRYISRVILLVLFAILTIAVLKNVKSLQLSSYIIIVCLLIYYILMPGSVVKHIIRQLKEMYPIK